MKNTLVRIIGISFSMAALMMTVAAQDELKDQSKQESATSNQSSNRIVGAWETTVTPRNCDTGEQVAPSFAGVITYNEGGTVAEFGANPATPFRTPGHGVWESRRGRSFAMRFSFLPLTPAGAPVGRMRVTQEIELERFSDELSSIGSFVLTNLSGVVIGTGCSTSTAVRIEL